MGIKYTCRSLVWLVVILKDTTTVFWNQTRKINYIGIERASTLGHRDLIK